MNFDFADILIEVIEADASDLHLTAGSPPMVREKGRLRALDYPQLNPQDTREIVYSIPNKARFRVNAFFQRASIGCVMRTIPQDIPKLESLGLPPVLGDFTRKP